MIVKCKDCGAFFDDEFRSYVCPHDTFAANDGNNNFAHHEDSYISCSSPTPKNLKGEAEQ